MTTFDAPKPHAPRCAACGFEFELGDGIGTRLCFTCEREERERIRDEEDEDTDGTFAYLDDLEWNVDARANLDVEASKEKRS